MDTKSKGEAYSSISNSRTSVRFYKIIEKNYKNYCVFSINPHGKYYLPLYSTRIQLLPFSQKKKNPTLGQNVAFFFFSAVNESMQLSILIFLPKSLLTPNDLSFFSNASRWFVLWWVQIQSSTIFVFILHLCQFIFSWVIGCKTHNSPIYTASLLIHIRGLYNGR